MLLIFLIINQILHLVFNKPVINPAIPPATKAIAKENHGLYPVVINILVIAAPSIKLPSQVRSGKSIIRNVK